MDFAPSAFWNSRSITHLADYPSPSLPMIFSDESNKEATPSGNLQPQGGKYTVNHSGLSMRVLVVEDELKMAALLKQGLEEHDHSVTVVHDGQEAVEIASVHAFDVIVLDVMLPGLDGFEVARRLRENHKPVPIL